MLLIIYNKIFQLNKFSEVVKGFNRSKKVMDVR